MFSHNFIALSQVDYFNNYLRDPKRPQLPEHPGRASSRPAGAPGGGGGGRPDFSMGGSSYQSNPGSFHGGFNPRGGYGGQYQAGTVGGWFTLGFLLRGADSEPYPPRPPYVNTLHS